MTPEQRQLLEGDEKRNARNLPRMGWADATTAEPRFALRIAEIRQCLQAGRPITPPSAEYRAAAERAQAVEQRLFPQQRAKQHAETTTTTRVDKLRRSLDALSIF
jgi:hypothetical protein